MRILVADDDPVFRHLVQGELRQWGHDVLAVADGNAAWAEMQKADAPGMAIVDWMMPGVDGVELCRRARESVSARQLHIIILTARDRTNDIVQALDAGADGYMTKPFDAATLRARVGAGERVVGLQRELATKIAELEEALAQVDELHGILPICSYCKKIRSDAGSWHQIEEYVSAHSSARFSHGACPDCVAKVLMPQIDALRQARGDASQNRP